MSKSVRPKGQIIKKGKDKWLIRVFLGRDASGKRLYFSRVISGKKKDAEQYLAKTLRAQKHGRPFEADLISLNQLLDRWLDESVHIKVREATFDGYLAKLRVHVRNGIGKKRLGDIDGHDIQSLYNKMIRNGLSATTVRHVHNLLSPALKQAMKWKLLSQNPCEFCELPQIEKKEMQFFTPQQTARFLKFAEGDRYYAAFVLAIESGMRPEEYLGLKWKDIDFEQSKASIRRALVIRKGGGYRFTETKTSKSRRSIPLSRSLISILKHHRQKQLEMRLKLGAVYKPNDLVFPTEIGTPTLNGNLDRRHFKKIIQKANDAAAAGHKANPEDQELLPSIRLYDLRHTMATLLFSKGVNPKIVSERLGHSSIVLTLDTYSHVLPTIQQNATDHMESLMFRR